MLKAVLKFVLCCWFHWCWLVRMDVLEYCNVAVLCVWGSGWPVRLWPCHSATRCRETPALLPSGCRLVANPDPKGVKTLPLVNGIAPWVCTATHGFMSVLIKHFWARKHSLFSVTKALGLKLHTHSTRMKYRCMETAGWQELNTRYYLSI